MKSKKLLVLSAACIALSACSSSTPKPIVEDKVNLFTAYSHENLLSDRDYFNEEGSIYKSRGTTLKFEGLKNENDGYQLVMNAKKDITSYNFVINDDIKDSKGNKLDKSNFNVYVTWYQYVNASVESVQYCEKGFYPDALIPIDKYIERKRDYIDKGRNQALYVNLKIPKDQVEGEYNGTATLTVDSYTYNIPINVIVHPTVMSDDNHLNSCFLIWYNQISIGEKEVAEDLPKKYYDTLLSKRLSPDQLPDKYISSETDFAESVEKLIAPNSKISQYRMPITYTNYSKQRVEKYMKALVDQQNELLNNYKGEGEILDLFKKLYFYVDDEPTDKSYDTVKEHDKEIYEIKKACMDEITGGGTSEQVIKARETIKNSILHMKNIVTSPYTKELKATENTGGVQTWCPQFQHFNTVANRATYKERQSSTDRSCGENVWWYGCMDPKGPYPSYHLDATTSYARILPYMTFNYGVEGILYWCTNFYQQHMNGTTGGRDVWNDPITWENCNGDGCLLYPGSEYNCTAPLSTLRLENILAGNEEYEYLYMLNQYVQKYNEERKQEYVLNDLLAKEYAKMYVGVKVNRDEDKVVDTSKVLDCAHTLLKALDAFNESLDKGMEYLISLSK